MTYDTKSPIENVVRTVQTKKAIIGGIIIRNLSSVTVSPIIRQKVVQIIIFTTVEYLKEVRSNDFPFLIFLYANFPPIPRASRNATISPMVEIPYAPRIAIVIRPSPNIKLGTNIVAKTTKIPIGAPIR